MHSAPCMCSCSQSLSAHVWWFAKLHVWLKLYLGCLQIFEDLTIPRATYNRTVMWSSGEPQTSERNRKTHTRMHTGTYMRCISSAHTGVVRIMWFNITFMSEQRYRKINVVSSCFKDDILQKVKPFLKHLGTIAHLAENQVLQIQDVISHISGRVVNSSLLRVTLYFQTSETARLPDAKKKQTNCGFY